MESETALRKVYRGLVILNLLHKPPLQVVTAIAYLSVTTVDAFDIATS
jgi:hypothetical protein